MTLTYLHSSLELDTTISDCKIAYDRVDKWARTEKAPFNITFAAFRPVIRKEPKGVVLSISPFNYPVWLTLSPVVCSFSSFTTLASNSLFPFQDWSNCCWQLCRSQTV
jgi:acyl-CoA reductase-like NAD-dependent aldehyde dehydrogenase